jgi:hypothetical protein
MKQLFILSSLFLLVGCTVTKRNFNSGYHVEWKRPLQSTKERGVENKDIGLKNDLSEVRSVIPDAKQPVSENEIPAESVQISEVTEIENPEAQIEEQKDISGTQQELKTNSVINPDSVSDDEVPIDQPKRKVDPFTWVALGGIFLGLLLLLTIGFTDITLAVLTGIGLLVIIFSIISIIRILKHPERYKAKGLTWTLFGLSTAGIGLALFILIWYLLLITNNIDL